MRKEKRIIGPLAKLWGSNLTDGSLTDPPPTTPFLPSRHACAKVLLENKQSQEASAAHSPAGRYTAPLSTARIMSRTDSIREEPRPARWPRLGEWTAASGARGGGHPHRDGVWKPCGADGGSDRHSDPPPVVTRQHAWADRFSEIPGQLRSIVSVSSQPEQEKVGRSV